MARKRTARKGAQVAELAILLPFLAFIFVAAIDYARIFYYYVAVTNSARVGALYGCSNATRAADTAGIKSAAQAEAPDLSSSLDVSSRTGTDSSGNPFVTVTVTYTFTTLTQYPGIPSSATVSRTVQMRVSPP